MCVNTVLAGILLIGDVTDVMGSDESHRRLEIRNPEKAETVLGEAVIRLVELTKE